jgi:hypothetical protein
LFEANDQHWLMMTNISAIIVSGQAGRPEPQAGWRQQFIQITMAGIQTWLWMMASIAD